MKKLLICILCLAALGGVLKADIIVTSPSSRDEVKSCSEYSDETLLDRWDMNERTDLGWRIYNTYELPLSYLSSISCALSV